MVFLINIVSLMSIILLYFYKIIIFELFLALIFFQALICCVSLFLYYIYKRLQKLANALNFKYIKGSFPHPKFEGYYKNKWWQLHFVSKEEGEQWGKPRTYVKLQYKDLKKYDEEILKKYKNLKLNGNKIVEVKHVVREYKNYLLLKRDLPTLNKKKICELMDLLLKIEKEAEIKKKHSTKK